MGFEAPSYYDDFLVPDRWEINTIENVLETIIDYRGKTPPKSSSGIPVLTSSNVRGGRINLNKVTYISKDTYNHVTTRGLPKQGDILFTTEAPIGEVALFPGDGVYHITRRIIALRTKQKICDNRFLLYSLMNTKTRNRLRARERGSTVERILKKDLTKLTLPFPPLPEQHAIAHVLGTLDDKIELNRRMNKTLEAIAQVLFKSWFVDFDPVRAMKEGSDSCLSKENSDLFPDEFQESEMGEIPIGWEIKKLRDIADNPRRGVHPNEVNPSTPYIGLEHMPRHSIALTNWDDASDLHSNKFIFKRHDILFGKLRPYFHKVGIAPVDGICSTDIVVISPKNSQWLEFVLCHVSSKEFIDYSQMNSTGTKMPRTNWKDMSRYHIVVPPEIIIITFSSLIRPFIKKIISNIHESKSIIALRDALLPKLITGEILIRQPDRFLEDIGVSA